MGKMIQIQIVILSRFTKKKVIFSSEVLNSYGSSHKSYIED